MDAFPRNRVQIYRRGGGQSFAFAGLHFGDPPLMQNDAADDLHVKVALAQSAARRLAGCRERFRQQIIGRLPFFQPLFESGGFGLQAVIIQIPKIFFQRINLFRQRFEFFEIIFVFVAENPSKKWHNVKLPISNKCQNFKIPKLKIPSFCHLLKIGNWKLVIGFMPPYCSRIYKKRKPRSAKGALYVFSVSLWISDHGSVLLTKNNIVRQATSPAFVSFFADTYFSFKIGKEQPVPTTNFLPPFSCFASADYLLFGN